MPKFEVNKSYFPSRVYIYMHHLNMSIYIFTVRTRGIRGANCLSCVFLNFTVSNDTI